MEYNLTILDAIRIMKRAWKTIILIAIIFALLGFGVTKLSSSKESISEDEYAAYQEEAETYDQWAENQEYMAILTFDRLASSYDLLVNHPLMKVDAHDCTFTSIVLALDEQSPISLVSTVEVWLSNEFGDIQSEDCKYLTGVSGESGEVVITVWESEQYDLDEAAKTIESFVVKKAKDSGITVSNVSSAKTHGLSQVLYEKQDLLQYNVVRLQNALTTYNNTVKSAPATMGEGNSLRQMTRNGILAGFVGLLMGVFFVILRVVRKGVILSAAQAREMLGICELGLYNCQDNEKTKLLAATIGAASESGKYLLFDDADPAMCEKLATDLNEYDENEYTCESGLKEDAVSADAIAQSDGAILSIKLGETTVKEAQKSLLWANRFKKNTIGYVILEG